MITYYKKDKIKSIALIHPREDLKTAMIQLINKMVIKVKRVQNKMKKKEIKKGMRNI